MCSSVDGEIREGWYFVKKIMRERAWLIICFAQEINIPTCESNNMNWTIFVTTQFGNWHRWKIVHWSYYKEIETRDKRLRMHTIWNKFGIMYPDPTLSVGSLGVGGLPPASLLGRKGIHWLLHYRHSAAIFTSISQARAGLYLERSQWSDGGRAAEIFPQNLAWMICALSWRYVVVETCTYLLHCIQSSLA